MDKGREGGESLGILFPGGCDGVRVIESGGEWLLWSV
jgi:hypothetical protein